MLLIRWIIKLRQYLRNQKRLDIAARELAIYNLELKLNQNKEPLYIIDNTIRKSSTFVCHFDHKIIDLKKGFNPLTIPEIKNHIYHERHKRQLEEK